MCITEQNLLSCHAGAVLCIAMPKTIVRIIWDSKSDTAATAVSKVNHYPVPIPREEIAIRDSSRCFLAAMC